MGRITLCRLGSDWLRDLQKRAGMLQVMSGCTSQQHALTGNNLCKQCTELNFEEMANRQKTCHPLYVSLARPLGKN